MCMHVSCLSHIESFTSCSKRCVSTSGAENLPSHSEDHIDQLTSSSTQLPALYQRISSRAYGHGSLMTNRHLTWYPDRPLQSSQIMDDLIPKLLIFPPVPAPAELSNSQYDHSIRQIYQLLTSVSTAKLASGLSTGEDVFDVSAANIVRMSQSEENVQTEETVR